MASRLGRDERGALFMLKGDAPQMLPDVARLEGVTRGARRIAAVLEVPEASSS